MLGIKILSKLTALSCGLLLTACVSDGAPRDSIGRSMSLESKGSFQPYQTHFNAFTFLKPSQTYKTESIERNNGSVWTEQIISDKDSIFITIEHVNVAWFRQSTEDDMLDRNTFRKLATEFDIPEDKYVQIDKISPRTKGLIATNGKCTVARFVKRLKVLTGARNERGYPDTAVIFVNCGDSLTIPAEELVQKIDLITEAERTELAKTYKNIGPLTPKDKNKVQFTISWDGIAKDMQGEVKLTAKGAAQTDFTVTIAEPTMTCDGTSITDDKTQWTGTWSLTCSDKRTANGVWTSLGKGKGQVGTGQDNKGKDVEFTIGKS